MREKHSLLRPADPTSRPRFELPASQADLGSQVIAAPRRHRTALSVVLVLLALVTLALVMTTAFSLTPLWAPLVAFVALALYTVVLRVTNTRRESVAQAKSAGHHVEDDRTGVSASASKPAAELAHEQEVAASVPVLAHEAPEAEESEMTFAQRHETYVREVMQKRAGAVMQQSSSRPTSQVFRYGALSSQDTLESATLEESEARHEEGSYSPEESSIFANGMTLDQVLERRRA